MVMEAIVTVMKTRGSESGRERKRERGGGREGEGERDWRKVRK